MIISAQATKRFGDRSVFTVYSNSICEITVNDHRCSYSKVCFNTILCYTQAMMLETAKLQFGSLPKSCNYYLIINYNNHTGSHIYRIMTFDIFMWLPTFFLLRFYVTVRLHFIAMRTISHYRGMRALSITVRSVGESVWGRSFGRSNRRSVDRLVDRSVSLLASRSIDRLVDRLVICRRCRSFR